MKHILQLFALLSLALAAQAQTFTTLKSFGIFTNMMGFGPGRLTEGPDGMLYGACGAGEGYGLRGNVYKVRPDGSGFVVLKWFTNLVEGYTPSSSLILDNGVLYGTTYYGGGSTIGSGTIFKVNTDGSGYTVLKNLLNSGRNPNSLLLDGGTLYGTTERGGSFDRGTVFKINTDGTDFVALRNLPGSDGSNPIISAIQDGILYGTIATGGSGGSSGSVFKMNTNGTDFSTLKLFTTSSDGLRPGRMVLENDTLYGVTTMGGNASGYGTLFKLNINGTAFEVLKTFESVDGARSASLFVNGGVLYGTTAGNTTLHIKGEIFKLNTDGTGFSVLKDLNETDSQSAVGFVLHGDTLYGAASGGISESGQLFSIKTNGLDYTGIIDFVFSDGNGPQTLIASGCTLYGTTKTGGRFLDGSIFKMNTDGTGYTVLRNFSGNDGDSPWSGLILDGNTLYGTTYRGGASNCGTVFKLNTDGSDFTVLKSFNGPEGKGPRAKLALSNGTLYGTTEARENSGSGTAFRINTDGTGFTVIRGFDSYVNAPLAWYEGKLYGTTYNDGAGNAGTIFRMNPDGTGHQVLKDLTSLEGFNSQNGVTVISNLIYTKLDGRVVTMNLDGTGFTMRGSFTNSEGTAISGIAWKGNTLYATTSDGGFRIGTFGTPSGTVFKMNLDGTGYTALKRFAGSDGRAPHGICLDGNTLYGGTTYGGVWDTGTIWSYEEPLAPAIVGQPITQTVSPGAPTTLSVCVSGSGPLFYQWLLNGTNLAGENSATLTLTNTAVDAGHYCVIVSNNLGSVTSEVAIVAAMKLNFHPVVTIYGSIGDRYRVDYVDDVTSTNWQVLNEIILPSNPTLVIDTNSPNSNHRFYRAVYEP